MNWASVMATLSLTYGRLSHTSLSLIISDRPMGIPKRLAWLPVAILGIGIAFHALYVFSVITIYFQSPLVFGLSPYRGMPQDPPAHRLVLFVGMSNCAFLCGLKEDGSMNRAFRVACVGLSFGGPFWAFSSSLAQFRDQNRCADTC